MAGEERSTAWEKVLSSRVDAWAAPLSPGGGGDRGEDWPDLAGVTLESQLVPFPTPPPLSAPSRPIGTTDRLTGPLRSLPAEPRAAPDAPARPPISPGPGAGSANALRPEIERSERASAPPRPSASVRTEVPLPAPPPSPEKRRPRTAPSSSVLPIPPASEPTRLAASFELLAVEGLELPVVADLPDTVRPSALPKELDARPEIRAAPSSGHSLHPTSEFVAGRDELCGSRPRAAGERGSSDREERKSASSGRRGGDVASPTDAAGKARVDPVDAVNAVDAVDAVDPAELPEPAQLKITSEPEPVAGRSAGGREPDEASSAPFHEEAAEPGRVPTQSLRSSVPVRSGLLEGLPLPPLEPFPTWEGGHAPEEQEVLAPTDPLESVTASLLANPPTEPAAQWEPPTFHALSPSGTARFKAEHSGERLPDALESLEFVMEVEAESRAAPGRSSQAASPSPPTAPAVRQAALMTATPGGTVENPAEDGQARLERLERPSPGSLKSLLGALPLPSGATYSSRRSTRANLGNPGLSPVRRKSDEEVLSLETPIENTLEPESSAAAIVPAGSNRMGDVSSRGTRSGGESADGRTPAHGEPARQATREADGRPTLPAPSLAELGLEGGVPILLPRGPQAVNVPQAAPSPGPATAQRSSSKQRASSTPPGPASEPVLPGASGMVPTLSMGSVGGCDLPGPGLGASQGPLPPAAPQPEGASKARSARTLEQENGEALELPPLELDLLQGPDVPLHSAGPPSSFLPELMMPEGSPRNPLVAASGFPPLEGLPGGGGLELPTVSPLDEVSAEAGVAGLELPPWDPVAADAGPSSDVPPGFSPGVSALPGGAGRSEPGPSGGDRAKAAEGPGATRDRRLPVMSVPLSKESLQKMAQAAGARARDARDAARGQAPLGLTLRQWNLVREAAHWSVLGLVLLACLLVGYLALNRTPTSTTILYQLRAGVAQIVAMVTGEEYVPPATATPSSIAERAPVPLEGAGDAPDAPSASSLVTPEQERTPPPAALRRMLERYVREGTSAYENADLAQAASHYEQALELAVTLKDDATRQWIRRELARCYQQRGELIMRDTFVTRDDCKEAELHILRAQALGATGRLIQSSLLSAQRCTNLRPGKPGK